MVTVYLSFATTSHLGPMNNRDIVFNFLFVMSGVWPAL